MEMNGTTIIHRPIEEVTNYVLDVTKDANWRNGVDESGFLSLNLKRIDYKIALYYA
jgi:hypothetical protein